MSDELQQPLDGDPNLQQPDDTDAASLAIDDGKGNKLVPLSALVAAKREGKQHRDRVRELEPIAARATDINQRLERAQPIIDAVVTNPKLRAEALRIVQGTRPTSDGNAVADPSEDPDASAIAEEFGFYRADGVTPDVERGRRVLSRLDQRHGKQTDERIRPLAGLTLNQKANENLREAAQMTDGEGVPFATRESIAEVAKQLPPHLLANPEVLDLVINSAIGLDKRKGRTPKPVDEPIFLERQGGNRQPREAVISPDEKRQLERFGLTEKDYQASSKRLEAGVANRRGIVLGS